MSCSGSQPTILTSAWLRVLVVLSLLLTQTPVVPAVLLGAAALDGGHGIGCGVNCQGAEIRLAHRGGVAQPKLSVAPRHHHSVLLQVFVRDAAGDADHRFGFASPAPAVEESADACKLAATDGGPVPTILATASAFIHPVLALQVGSFRATTAAHGPPALDRLRTVVMRT